MAGRPDCWRYKNNTESECECTTTVVVPFPPWYVGTATTYSNIICFTNCTVGYRDDATQHKFVDKQNYICHILFLNSNHSTNCSTVTVREGETSLSLFFTSRLLPSHQICNPPTTEASTRRAIAYIVEMSRVDRSVVPSNIVLAFRF